MKIYTIKFKLVKFKSTNTTSYTLKWDFKNEIIWIQYIVPCSILGRIWQNITNLTTKILIFWLTPLKENDS
jgi:hypothetical protein